MISNMGQKNLTKVGNNMGGESTLHHYHPHIYQDFISIIIIMFVLNNK